MGPEFYLTEFTPWSALIGGGFIGLSAVLLMLFLGRIAGISGIVRGALTWNLAKDERLWRLAFLIGLVLAYPLFNFLFNQAPLLQLHLSHGWALFSGLLVGFGVSLANGCTSGHGVCGLARLSKRSLWAVISFMASAGLTVFLIRHIIVN